MKEHLEVINHIEALPMLEAAEKKIPFTEKELLTIHHFFSTRNSIR
jgi:hypothetical protein